MLFALLSTDLVSYIPDALRVFLAVWLFAVGSCVGSFLNVVVLRLPAGVGIARSGSRCPVCLHSIRWFDNIPILSWLVLRGRCRDCRTPISARYPIVELLVALMFLALGWAEVLSAGANVPTPQAASLYFRYTPFQVWSFYVFQVSVLTTVLGAALIERDRNEVPLRLYLPWLLAGLAVSGSLPFVHPVESHLVASGPDWLRGVIDAVCGLAAGVLLAAACWPAAMRQPWRPKSGRTAVWSGAAVGLCLGWQAMGPVVVLASLAFLAASVLGCLHPRARRGNWGLYLTASLLLFLMFWRPFTQAAPFLVGDNLGLLLGSVLIASAVAWMTAWLTPAREFLEPAEKEDVEMTLPADRDANLKAILESPSYLPVEYDAEFLQQWETRPVHMQLELLKPEIGLTNEGVASTIVVFGGTQVVEREMAESRLQAAQEALAASPNDPQARRAVERYTRIVAKCSYYDAARAFGKLVSSNCQIDGKCDYVIVTGGGPGIMEAANRGAHDVGAKSIGLNITLPSEQVPNPYITPQLCFQFHYFALRKMHFLLRAKAMVVFPGGFGTLDELFDALTLRQTRRMQEIPIILFGSDFWRQVINFQFLADEGVVADRDLELISFADTPEEAWEIIVRFHSQLRS